MPGNLNPSIYPVSFNIQSGSRENSRMGNVGARLTKYKTRWGYQIPLDEWHTQMPYFYLNQYVLFWSTTLQICHNVWETEWNGHDGWSQSILEYHGMFVRYFGFWDIALSVASAGTQVPQLLMTSSNGNIFRVTGPLCKEFTSHGWISRTKASDAKLWCFHWSVPE